MFDICSTISVVSLPIGICLTITWHTSKQLDMAYAAKITREHMSCKILPWWLYTFHDSSVYLYIHTYIMRLCDCMRESMWVWMLACVCVGGENTGFVREREKGRKMKEITRILKLSYSTCYFFRNASVWKILTHTVEIPFLICGL